MAKRLIFCFLLACANAIVHSNYDIVKNNRCWRGRLPLDRAILIEMDDFMTEKIRNPGYDCSMIVESYRSEIGIITVIQQLKPRKPSQDDCFPHIWFSRDRRICGEILFGQQILKNGSISIPPRNISEFAGRFASTDSPRYLPSGVTVGGSSYLTIATRHEPPEPGEQLSLLVAFTAFKECDALNVPKGMFNCGYGLCILDIFVDDGIVNCPFGDCRDEGSCEEAIELINGFKNDTDIESPFLNSTIDSPIAATPFIRWLQNAKAKQRLPIEESETKISEEIRKFGKDFEKHNIFLERILQVLQTDIVPGIRNVS